MAGGEFHGGGFHHGFHHDRGGDSYYDNGDCYTVQRRVHSRIGWHVHPVQVCGRSRCLRRLKEGSVN
jgi:hypothetical protein